MHQHALDDRIGALAVLHNLFEIAAQRVGQVLDLDLHFRVNRQTAQSILQLTDQFGRNTGKIVDKIERVFDLVLDTGGELPERVQLFGSAPGDPA